jgi:lambda repressor-like predicted transcriptional regulator
MDEELAALARLRVLQEHLRETELMAIQSLRQQGCTLPQIAEPMGLTRQTLRKRLLTGYYGKTLRTARPEGDA